MFYTKYSSVYTEVLFQLSLLLFSDTGSLCVDQDYLKCESLPPRRPKCPLLKVDFSTSNSPLMVVIISSWIRTYMTACRMFTTREACHSRWCQCV